MPEEGPTAVTGRAPSVADAIMEAARIAGIGVFVAYIDEAEPRVVHATEAAAAIIGCSVEEYLTRPPFSAVAPEEQPRLRDRFARRQAGETVPIRYETLVVHRDGHRIPVEISTAVGEYERRKATFSFIVDITERKRTEDAVRESNSIFRRLIDAAPEPITISGRGRFLYANAAYLSLLGYDSIDELRNKPLTEVLHPEEYERARLREAGYAHGDRPSSAVFRLLRRDETEILFEVNGVALEYDGAPAVLSIGRDVTERKRMEAQLIQADRLAALGTLAAGVAHEVNNPLSYLLLNLEWLARQLPLLAQDPARLPELSAMLEEARHGAERVGAIVRELRSFSRTDDETRGPIDLRVVATSAIKMASHEIRHRAKVTTEFEAVPPVWANQTRLEQVMLNLLMNAVQAMPETSIDRNSIRVVVRARDPGHVVVEIADNGVGIPPEVQRRIFDPFFTTKPLGVGTGLGLSICHSIVSSLGGRMSVQSEVGHGSVFRMDLPARGVAADRRSPTLEPPSAEHRTLKRARVLVIDDELSLANTLRDLLQAEHEVTAVVSAQDALDILRMTSNFDVIICDLMMPSMSGMDFYEAARQKHPGVEQRLVFMTGGAFTPRAAEFLSRIPNRRLEKPFSLSAIERIVREVAHELEAGDRSEGQGSVA